MSENKSETIGEERSNRDIVMGALKAVGAKSVLVEYNGSGDSGQVDDVSIEMKNSVDVMDESMKVEVKKKSQRFENGGWVREEKMTEESLTEAVKEFCYDILESLHGGWEINEGSQGHFDIDVEADTITLHHGSNFMETTETEHEV